MIIHGPKVGAAGSFSGGRSSRRLMGGSSGRGAAQSGAVAARAGGRLPGARPLGVDGRLRLVHTFRARLLRWGSIADSFQHAPEARGSAAGGRHHVAAAEKR